MDKNSEFHCIVNKMLYGKFKHKYQKINTY